MNKKTFVGLTLLSLLLIAPLKMEASAFKFRIFGGGIYLQGGDLNSGLQGWTDYWKAYRNLQGYTQQTGSFNPVHFGLNVGGDVILQLSPHWGLGVGTEYIMATKSSVFAFQSLTKQINWNILGKVQAVPAKLSVFYFMPVKDSLTIVIHAGAGYYSAKTRLESLTDVDPNMEYIIDASAQGTGFHGGLGLELKLSTGVHFFIEGVGRYASLSGFKGKTSITGDGSWDGKLYYWEATKSFIDNYGYIDLLVSPPTVPSVNFVREAKIDFSGLSLRAGIVVIL
ncbi:MAG: hypothetical protein NTW95_12365 [Candidatus Aminicenantes bacterium]|nr:hypothetical protein [Candidatus Aminicenantes bacterium]